MSLYFINRKFQIISIQHYLRGINLSLHFVQRCPRTANLKNMKNVSNITEADEEASCLYERGKGSVETSEVPEVDHKIAVTVENFVSEVNGLKSVLSDASEASQVENQRSALNALRVMLNQGVEIWPKYDVLRAQRSLQGLEEIFDATRRRLVPRRKFQFRSAVHSTTQTVRKPVAASPEASPMTPTENEDKVGYKNPGMKSSDVDGETLVEVGEDDRGLSIIGYDQEIEGRAVVVRGRGHNAKVSLRDGSRSVRVVGLSMCVVETGYVNGSVWISDCTKCVFRTRCRQLRVHSSTNCKLFVHVTGSPVIENCSSLAFGPLQEEGAGDQSRNKWNDVVDMSFLRESGSNNWTIATLPTDDDDAWVLASCK